MNGVMDVVKVSDVRIRKSNLCVKRKQQKLIKLLMDKKELYRFKRPIPPLPAGIFDRNFGGQPRGSETPWPIEVLIRGADGV